MGIGEDYFDELELDYTIEVPDEGSLENRRRLLYLVKAEANGAPMMLGYVGSTPGDIVSVSAEFTTLTGWTLEDIQNLVLEGDPLFTPASNPIAAIHAGNNLVAPWVGEMYKKNEAVLAVKVQGVTFVVDELIWRAVIFEPYP